MFDSLELALPLPVDIEAEEVRLAKERDPQVWSAWYDRYFPLLYRYVYVRTGRREDAEDIAAQAFVRAIEGIDRYAYRGKPVLAWLYRITHNLVADRSRRDKRRPFVSIEALGVDVAESDGDTARIELSDALSRLKPEQREVLVLRFLLSLNTREIAALLGKSESAVYSLQVRAIASLRKSLVA